MPWNNAFNQNPDLSRVSHQPRVKTENNSGSENNNGSEITDFNNISTTIDGFARMASEIINSNDSKIGKENELIALKHDVQSFYAGLRKKEQQAVQIQINSLFRTINTLQS
jgi:hypothetical protein